MGARLHPIDNILHWQRWALGDGIGAVPEYNRRVVGSGVVLAQRVEQLADPGGLRMLV